MRDERDEVSAQRGEPAQLVSGAALSLVRADVLHRRRDEATKEVEKLDLLGREAVLLRPDEPEHADRPRPHLERRKDPTAEAEREQILLLGIPVFLHGRPIDQLAFQHFVER